MSGTWDADLAGLSDQLGQEGAISPAQAEMLQRLVAEVGALSRGWTALHGDILVRTAVALLPEEQAQFKKLLGQRFAGRPVTFEVQPQLLGGVWLRVGDRIIDSSLRGQLETLRKQMAAGRA